MSERLLILGNSAAALAALRAYRAAGGEGRVTMVSREPCDAYSPVLTTYYLRGRIPEEHLFVCDASLYEDAGAERVFGPAAVGLDTGAQVVELDDGRRLEYDRLLIATGASPRRLDGLDPEAAEDVCYLRTIDDARRIRARAEGASHVVVVGGGLVSLQVAAALAREGRRVTAIVSSGQILSQNVDAAAAAIVQARLESTGCIDFRFGADVRAIERTAAGSRVSLDTGETIDAGLVVVGKGVSPNLEFVDRRAIRVERAVVVDGRMRTTAANVFAAGDVCEGPGRLSDALEPVPNWVNACEQGRVAGLELAGRGIDFAGSLPENVTSFFGLVVASMGLTRSADTGVDLHEMTWEGKGRDRYRKLVFRGERLVGALLVGDVRDAGVLRDVIGTGGQLPVPAERAVRHGVDQGDRLRACLRVASRTGGSAE